MKKSLILCSLVLSFLGVSFSSKSQTLSSNLYQKLEKQSLILDKEVQKSLRSMHIRSTFREVSTYATEEDGKITLYTSMPTGGIIKILVSTPTPGPIPWADLNGNGQCDKGEELVGDYDTENDLTVNNSSITLYGDFYALKVIRAMITEMNVSKASNLMYLTATMNKISKIDLSKNHNLRYVQLSANKLTSLDLSGNSAITDLAVAMNQITSINLSQSSALKTCWIYGNKISSIELPSQFYSMVDLDVSSNHISGNLMDELITKLPNLKDSKGGVIVVIDTKDPAEENVCYKSSVKEAKDKNWAVKDNNGNPDFMQDYVGTDQPAHSPIDGPSIQFMTDLSPEIDSLNVGLLQLDKSQTAWIDLNGNQVCDEGEAINNSSVKKYKFTSRTIKIYGKVSTLNLKKNKITMLDISNCPDLMRLFVSENKLHNLDLMHNEKLRELHCDHNELNSLDLSKSQNLVDLYCSFNRLTHIDMTKCVNIAHLSLMSNNLEAIRLDPDANKLLRDFNINGNTIGVEAMGEIINNLPTLKPSYGAVIVVIDTKANPKDRNVCSIIQVKKAMTKNWKVMDFNGRFEDRKPYLGSEEGHEVDHAPVDGPRIELTTTTPANETINIVVRQAQANESQVPWVDLNGNNQFEQNETLTAGKNKIKVVSPTMKIYGNFVKFEAKGANLSSINVVKATALDTLNLFQNALTTLDLSQNVNLTTLDVAKNALLDLDLSHNLHLTSLNCAINKLTSLDLSHNYRLKVISAYKNELVSISLSPSADSKLNKVVINSNKINEQEMARIVKNLPERTVSDKAQIVVINTKDDAESNVCTKAEVATAKGKNWMVKDFNGSYKKMIDYEGSESQAQFAPRVIEKANIVVYPTTVKKQFTVQLPTSYIHHTLSLFDLEGRQLLSLPITQQKMTVNVNDLPIGIYFVHVNGQTKKIVKE